MADNSQQIRMDRDWLVSIGMLTSAMPAKQVRVFLSFIQALKSGTRMSTATQPQVMAETKVDRKTIYNYIQEWIEIGLVKQYHRGPFETHQKFLTFILPVQPSVMEHYTKPRSRKRVNSSTARQVQPEALQLPTPDVTPEVIAEAIIPEPTKVEVTVEETPTADVQQSDPAPVEVAEVPTPPVKVNPEVSGFQRWLGFRLNEIKRGHNTDAPLGQYLQYTGPLRIRGDNVELDRPWAENLLSEVKSQSEFNQLIQENQSLQPTLELPDSKEILSELERRLNVFHWSGSEFLAKTFVGLDSQFEKMRDEHERRGIVLRFMREEHIPDLKSLLNRAEAEHLKAQGYQMIGGPAESQVAQDDEEVPTEPDPQVTDATEATVEIVDESRDQDSEEGEMARRSLKSEIDQDLDVIEGGCSLDLPIPRLLKQKGFLKVTPDGLRTFSPDRYAALRYLKDACKNTIANYELLKQDLETLNLTIPDGYYSTMSWINGELNRYSLKQSWVRREIEKHVTRPLSVLDDQQIYIAVLKVMADHKLYTADDVVTKAQREDHRTQLETGTHISLAEFFRQDKEIKPKGIDEMLSKIEAAKKGVVEQVEEEPTRVNGIPNRCPVLNGGDPEFNSPVCLICDDRDKCMESYNVVQFPLVADRTEITGSEAVGPKLSEDPISPEERAAGDIKT